MSIDESRIESVQSGAEEGAGVRVVDGGTTYFAHVDGLDPADLERAAAEAASALRGERREPRPLEARGDHAAADRAPPRGGAGRAQGGAAARARRARPRRRAPRSPSSSPPTPRRAARSPSPTPTGLFTGDDRTRTRIGAQAVARRGDTVETGAETLGAHRGFELLEDDPGAIAEQAARKALTLLDAGPAPGGLDAGRRRRRLRRRPLPRDDRPRPRGRPHPEGRQRLRRQARRAGRPAAAERLRRRPPAGRVGQRRDRRRGHADPEDAGDRGRPARLLPLRPRSAPSATASPRPATAAARASATCRSRA